ncbi:MAG: Rpn family recombination-promoting nuclease/putative transposase [Lachnospiraceae bacterium]|nr:Rpn family recombination-promoting nuclease/putative transposase [Lachnospiraceae bacterium]
MTNLNSIGRNLSTASRTKANPSISLLTPLSEKTGALACTLQNDYLFKTVILDVKLLLNNSRIVNLEMQRFNKGDWPERSLFYLCRTFGNLPAGESYANVLPRIISAFWTFLCRIFPMNFLPTIIL